MFTDKVGQLTHDLLLNLLDMATEWTATGENSFEGRDRKNKALGWTATASM